MVGPARIAIVCIDNIFHGAGNGTALPQWVEVAFNGSKTINQIDVFSLQDNYPNPIEPTESTTFSLYGLTAFEVQYWNGSSFETVPGGSVTGNNKVWKKVTFAPITTTKIRIHITATSDGWSRRVEVEAWTSANTNINWLITDHLGTPRMIIDQTGTLANVKRHDYLPFGEELFAGSGGRTPGDGYSGGDGVRQQFTLKERDNETGLDYFGARYFASTQGRFTGADPYDINYERQSTADQEKANTLFRNYIEQPQHWNHYSYALNNPLKYIDPDGLLEYETELLGRKIKVKINKVDKKDQENIKKRIDEAIARINKGADKLTPDQIKTINKMNGIEVRNDISGSFMHPENHFFQIKQTLAETPDNDYLSGAIIHDSFHASQMQQGLSFEGEENQREREREASSFAANVAEKTGLTQSTIDAFKRDAKEGHITPNRSPYTRPPKKKNP